MLYLFLVSQTTLSTTSKDDPRKIDYKCQKGNRAIQIFDGTWYCSVVNDTVKAVLIIYNF